MLSSRPLTDKKEEEKVEKEMTEGTPGLGSLLRKTGYQGVLK
jgi:hypothetical protein